MKLIRPYRYTKFAFVRYYPIMDHTNPHDVYLRRWYLIHTPWFGIYLHNILRPDGDRDMHDHPWNFRTIILNGAYREEVPGGLRWWRRWSMHKVPATGLHRIINVKPNTWTLVLVGKRQRQWGFQTQNGWVGYKTYLGINERNV